MGRKDKVYRALLAAEPCSPNKSRSSFPGKAAGLQAPRFLPGVFQPPLGTASRAKASGRGMAWHIFPPLRKKLFPLQLLRPVGPAAAGGFQQGHQFNSYSRIYPIFVVFMQSPVFTMFLYLPYCRVPDCTCTSFIPAVTSFSAVPLSLIIVVSFLCRLLLSSCLIPASP